MYDDVLERSEEAAAFHRQAADKYVEIGDDASEGRARSNLGHTLCKLRRFDEAREEIRRGLECGAQFGHSREPWKAWAILAKIETDAGDPAAAAEAQGKAVKCYLAYRRDSGENHNVDGRLALAVTQSLLAGKATEAAALLHQVAADPDAAWLLPIIQALQAVVGGSRDRSLADDAGLGYTMAAEILLLIETLETEAG